jgi:hypothetical protein
MPVAFWADNWLKFLRAWEHNFSAYRYDNEGMNVLRSLAREFLSLSGLEAAKQSGEIGLRTSLEKKTVPPVVKLDRFRDGFDQLPSKLDGQLHRLTGDRAFSKSNWASLSMAAPASTNSAAQTSSARFSAHQLDGFEPARRAPVDLLGGVRSKAALPEAAPLHQAAGSNGFTASLDDLL